MAQPVAGQQIVEVVFKHILHGNAVYNVFHALTETPFVSTDLDDELLNMITAWNTRMLPLMSSEVEGTGGTIQQIWPTVGALIAQETFNLGGVAEEALPNQVALVVTLQTGSPGRRARGRTFLGGFCESQFNGNTGLWIDGFPQGRADALTLMWDTPAVQANWEPVVWSTGSVVGPTPQYYAIESMVGRQIPATVRSRRIGRGI